MVASRPVPRFARFMGVSGTRAARVARLVARLVRGLILNRDGGRRLILRLAFFDLARWLTPSVAVQSDGLWYYVDTRDRLVGRYTFATGSFELDVMADALALLERLGHPLHGRTFVDVGANIGTSTIASVARFGARNAFAVEPEPGNVRLLRCNAIANGVDQDVRVVQAAASAGEGNGWLELQPGNSGDNRVQLEQRDSQAVNGAQTIKVPLRRLDDLLTEGGVELSEVGVVWIDTQGHEGHVFAGAPQLLESTVPVIAEYWPYGLKLGGDLDLFHSLVAAHYDYVIDARELVPGHEPHRIPASDVATLRERYPDPTFTDLILLKETELAG